MRKHNPTLTLRQGVLLASLVSLPFLAGAQVSLYEFSESVGTYTPITAADGGVALGVPTYWPQVSNNRAWVNNPFNDPGGQATQGGYFSPAEGPGYPIGFPFTFNGDVFDVIGISNGGWISFGKSSDGLQAVWVYNYSGTTQGDPFIQFVGPGATPAPVPSYRRNRVAGFGNSSLQQVDWSSLAPPGQVSQLRMATIGTAPNRVCVVQWEDYGLRGDVTVAMNKINFQIRLNEIDNSVDVVFGPQDWVSDLGRYVRTQSGLSGRSREDFNGRKTVYEEPAFLYDWNTTVAATDYLDYCQFTRPQFGQPNGSGIPPVEGRTWHWAAPVCPPPAWPLIIGDISYDAASASWEPIGTGEYEYFLTDTNDVNGPEVNSGTTTDPSISFFGLEPLTNYYLFIRRICDGEPGPWSMATRFRTIGGGVIVCDGTAQYVDYCSHQHDTIVWKYASADGSPMRIEFLNGFISGNTADYFQIWNGPDAVGPPTWTLNPGNPAGIGYNTGSAMTLRLITEQGSCETQDWFLPFEWRVGCKNCTDPLVNFTMGEVDCDNQEYTVSANVFSLGSSSSLIFNNTAGVPADTVAAPDTYVLGPFPVGSAFTVTAQNPDNAMCYATSVPFIQPPCALVDCGPTFYNYCYGDNEHSMWAYQGEAGQEIGIRFIQGSMGLGDDLYFYNGLDIDNIQPEEMGWLMANALFTSGSPSSDHALVMELISDDANSCADAGPIFDASEPWQYVVACYDGCVQPKATFADSCISTSAFMVNVTVTELGSTGSVTITSSSGASPVTATALGTYSVGPFQANVPVTIDVEGASILCTYTSTGRTKDCSGWTSSTSINEVDATPLHIFPNPSNGTFNLDVPQGARITAVQTMDITGRVVAQQAVDPNNGGASLHLEHLPNGLYTVVALGNDLRYATTISIQH